MKYTGNILIVDAEGESILDVELTQDDVIEMLVRKVKNPAPGLTVTSENIGTLYGIPVRSSVPVKKTPKAKKPKPSKSGATAPVRHECCRSRGAKHMKGCPQSPSALRDAAKPAKDADSTPCPGRFSRETYEKVKRMYENGATTEVIVAEKGLDPEELRRVRLSSAYADYNKP